MSSTMNHKVYTTPKATLAQTKQAMLDVLADGPIDIGLLSNIMQDYDTETVDAAKWALILSDLIKYTFDGTLELT